MAVGIQSDVIRALAARQQSVFFELRVSVTNDPDAEAYGLPGARVFVEVLGKSDFAGTQERLWRGSCSRRALVVELPDVLRALAHLSTLAASEVAEMSTEQDPSHPQGG